MKHILELSIGEFFEKWTNSQILTNQIEDDIAIEEGRNEISLFHIIIGKWWEKRRELRGR